VVFLKKDFPMPFSSFLSRLTKPAMGGQKKTSTSGPVVAYAQVGRPRWTPRRYDALAEEGYRRNIIAYRCISEVARGAASIPWLLYDADGRELDAHPLLEMLARPNPLQSGTQLRESLFSYYQIAGNAYVEVIRGDDGVPRELHVLRPDRMCVVPGESGLPQGYEYAVGGRKVRWAADPLTGASAILHWKAFHPLDDWYGMAPLEAAMIAIDQHNAASTWNQALLNQAARPSGALIYAPKDAPGHLSDEQFRRLKEELEEHYTSPRHAGRPLVLEGGLEWKEMGLSPKDMDWLAGRDRAARDIALAFGVPEQLIGISDSETYANMAEARLALYEETILPLAHLLCAEMNRWLAPQFGEDLRLAIDTDEIPALAARRDLVWDKLGRSDFLTRAEKREAVGYPPDEE
jgi:HK97 family phage portal protein